MLHYILQTIAFQVFFLLVYDLFLKKETFFNWNRVYLLITSLLSFILPFVKIQALQATIPQHYIISLPEIVIGSESNPINDVILLDTIYITSQSVSYIQWLFYLGLTVSLLLFTWKLYRIFKLIYKNPKTKNESFRVVNLLKSNAAFSFLNYVFIGDAIAKEEAQQIFEHEKIHVQQKHTLDLLYFEILRVLFWFNPLIYIYQNRTSELHEFIADAKASKQQNKKVYYQNLLAQIFDTKQVSFINTFFKQSLIKKRIAMLKKERSKTILKLKYALLLPLVFGMLVYTSCDQEEVAKKEDLSQYTYTLKMSEESMSDTNKEIHDKYEAFLIENSNYVGWAQIGSDNNSMTYSVHPISEEAPENLSKGTVNLVDGSTYVMYFEWTKQRNTAEMEDEDYLDKQIIPYAVIDQVPVFLECMTGNNKEQKKCTSKKIAEIVNKNFNIKLADELKLYGKQKIYVAFVIDKEGNITEVRSRAPHKVLEAEAKRVIKLLPKMIPGEHNGKAVSVPYSLPIVFQIHE